MEDLLFQNKYYNTTTGEEAQNNAIGAMLGILVAAFIAGFILSIVSTVNNGNNEKNYNKSVGSSQFFTAIATGQDEIIRDDGLRTFYQDITEFDADIATNSNEDTNGLYPTGISNLQIPEGTYGTLCSHLFDVAGESERDCANSGPISSYFVQEYLLAKSGDSEWINFEPTEPTRHSFLFIPFWLYLSITYVGVCIAGVIGSFVYARDSNYYYSDAKKKNKRPIFRRDLLLRIVNPLYAARAIYAELTLNDAKDKIGIAAEEKRRADIAKKRHFGSELQSLHDRKQKLTELYDANPTTALSKQIEKLNTAIKDLEELDSKMDEQTAIFIAEDYVEHAKETVLMAKARIAARKEIEKL